MPSIQLVILLSTLALIINLPLGWWRASLSKFSITWFLAIHLSIPFIYVFRMWAGVSNGFVIIILIMFAVMGQVIGGKLNAAD